MNYKKYLIAACAIAQVSVPLYSMEPAQSSRAAAPAAPSRAEPAKPERPAPRSIDFTLFKAVVECKGDQFRDKELKASQAERIQALLTAGANINVRNNFDATPLLIAISQQRPDIALLLLARGAHPSLADHQGSTPLHLAAMGDNKDLIRALIDRGANVNAADQYGVTPLHRVATNGKTGVAQWLIEKGAAINALDDNGDAPLHYAVRFNREDVVRELLDLGADVNIQAKPVPVPVKKGETEAKQRETKTLQQNTPLHIAARSKEPASIAIASLLVARGAMSGIRNKDLLTSLDVARRYENDVVAKIIMRTRA